MIYLACPYAHADPAVMQQRFEAVTKKAGELMSKGITVYSPITHNHPIQQMFNLPRTWEFWRERDIPFLSAADEIWVLTLPGFDKSVGVNAEIDYMRELCRPIVFINS